MKADRRLDAIQVISWIAVIAGVVFPVIARLEGKNVAQWPVFMVLAGIVGVFVHGVLRSLDKRIAEIEKSRGASGERRDGRD